MTRAWNWKTYGQALKRALWDNVTVVLHAPTLRCGWMDGGCFVAAHAVARIVDGELWGLIGPGGMVDHVVVRTPDGSGVLDADGFATARTMLHRWRKIMKMDMSLLKLEAPPWQDRDIACQVKLADELERRLRAELPSSYPREDGLAGAARRPNPPRIDPGTMTADELRGMLRALYMPVGGARAALEARLRHALAVRARFSGSPEELSRMTVPALKDVLRSVDWSTWGDKKRLVALVQKFASMPLAAAPPRQRPRRRMLAIVWTNPFTGARELRSWIDDTAGARAGVDRRMHDEQHARDDAAREHGLVFPPADISLQSSDEGLTQTSDEDLERWAAIVRDIEGRTLPRVGGIMLDNAEAHTREDRARRARLEQEARRPNPIIPPDELAQELASYLNTKVDPYDFGNYLLEQWQEQDPEQMEAAESRRGGGFVVQVDDLDDEERARFAKWLQTARADSRLTPLQEERRDDPLGVPSYLYFEDAKPLGKNAWCVHFTRHQFTSFERGATLEMLGLSTHWKQKANASCKVNLDDSIGLYERVFGFAFSAAAERSIFWRDKGRKCGKRAVLFQTDAAVIAYHVTDDERQVIFPLCSERNLYDIEFDSWGAVSIDGIDEDFKSLDDAIQYLETHAVGGAEQQPALRQANPRAIPLDDEAIWRDTQHIVHELHAHFTKVAQDRGAWAASAYGTLPHNFSILPLTTVLTTRTQVGRKKVDEIFLRVAVQEDPGVRAFIPTGTASLLRDGRNVVTLTVNGSYSVLDLVKASADTWGPFASQVHDVLRHEITHIADPAHGHSIPTYSATSSGAVHELDVYFNDPLEVRAFMREITDQIKRRIKFAAMEADPTAVAHTIVHENRVFNAMAPHLTPANRKLLLRAMTQVTVEEVEKRNAEIRAARPTSNTREKADEAAETVKRLLEHRFRDKGGIGWVASITVEPDPDEGHVIVVRTAPGEGHKNPFTRISQIAVVTNPKQKAKRRAS